MERRELIYRLVLVFMGAGLLFLALHDSLTMRAYNAEVLAGPRAVAWVADACGCDLNAVLEANKQTIICNEFNAPFCEGILQDNMVYPAK